MALFEHVEALLRKKIGLHAASLGSSAIATAVRARAGACRAPSLDAYVTSLEARPDELDRLIDEIVVNETWFFREAASFEMLGRRFAARAPGSAAYRVLSLPCATGEEAYSIAITLLEAGGGRAFEVLGVDVSIQALEKARSATYGKLSMRSGMAGYERFFETEGEQLRVASRVREHVRFARGNVLDPLLCAGETFDAVLCRNLLIYLETEARRAALRNLQRLLRDDGVLFVGHSEANEAIVAGLIKLGEARSFAFVKPQSAERPQPARSAHASRVATRESSSALPARRRESSTAVPAVRPASRTGLPATRDPSRSSTTIEAVQVDPLREARALADRGEVDAARKACDAVLASQGPSAAAYSLLGVIKQAGSDTGGALECFAKALYLDPTHYEALVCAALIYERNGNTHEAAMLRGRAERALRKAGA